MYATVSVRNLILPTFYLILSAGVLLLSKRSVKLFIFLAFGITVLSSYYFANKYLYFSEREYVYPPAPVVEKLKNISGFWRTWQYGNAYMEKNIPMHFGLYSPDGYNGMYPQRYGELLSLISSEGKNIPVVTRSDADIKPASEKEPLGANKYRLRMMSLMGVRYILEAKSGDDKEHKTSAERFPQDLFEPVWESDLWKIWEFKKVLPRAYLVDSYEIKTHKSEIISRIFSDGFDPGKSVILETTPVLPVTECKTSDKGKADITQYLPDKITISTSFQCRSLLILSDNFYPGWQAYVDGRKTAILKANYTFRAIGLPEGDHKVEFSYKPITFTIGATVSLIGFLILLVIVFK